MNYRLIPLAVLFCYAFSLTGQNDYIMNPSVINAELIQTTPPLSEINISPKLDLDTTKVSKPGYHPKKDWPLNSYIDFTALPTKNDLGVQKSYPEFNITRSTQLDFDGIGPTNVDPADPCIAIGPNHVVQMVNASSGSKLKIWHKDGTVALNEIYFDGITSINGAGDPIALYDARADRWLLSEFSISGNKMVVGISTSPDPLGSYHIYSFTAPNFPDYPKYSIWTDAYLITTNEDGVSPAYALDRTKMLAGDPDVTAQRFTIPEFPTINFQAATPVGMVGTNLPPSGSPGLIMRMADDAWSTSIPEDRLEIWEFDIDFENEANTSLTGPIILETEPFDSNLCGYSSYSCIDQPDSPLDLDPLREVLMNKIAYRNFGDYESIVCTHVTDVDGDDRAGVRWYELRNEGNGWEIYQQSTYAPDYDDASRWMSSACINADGSIGLAYNISSSSIYPGMRYTGRTACDPLNEMTHPETTIKEGTSKNGSNRWGDYSCLDVDPGNGSFWYTAGYTKNDSWDTHIGNFIIEDDCFGISLSLEQSEYNICHGDDINLEFDLSFDGGYTEETSFDIVDFPSGLSGIFSDNNVTVGGSYTLAIGNTDQLSVGTYIFSLLALSGNDNEEVQITLVIDENITGITGLNNPTNNSAGLGTLPIFDWQDLSNASTYTLEIALKANFNQGLQVFTNITDSQYMLTNELDQNTKYFWRVKAFNACNESSYSEKYSFTTGGESCNELVSADTPIVIATSGTPTIHSIINFAGEGSVSSISISNIDITHTYISDLRIKLISPSGTEILLLDGICGSNDNMNIGFEDDGTNPINCPPTDQLLYEPSDALSSLINEDANGDWTLQIKDKYNYDGGALNSWSLDICTIGSDIDCDPNLEITENPIGDGMYQASENIMSTGMVPTNGNVTFKAGQGVELENGFETEMGAVFEIQIGNCNN